MTDITERTQGEQKEEDERRYAFAKGTVAIRYVCDRVSVIAIEGATISSDDLNSIQSALHDAWFELFRATRISDVSLEGTREEEIAADLNDDHYSDGSAVSELVPRSNVAPWPQWRDGFYYDGNIPWLPNITVAYDGDSSPGPVPAGVEVVVNKPPYMRAGGR